MHEIPHFEVVIFDLDGLVLDTEPTYFIAWAYALERMGCADAEVFCQSLIGLAYSAITEKLLMTYGEDFDLQQFSKVSRDYWQQLVSTEGIAIKPGFETLIASLQQFDIAFCLATNSLAVNARECLRLAGLDGVFSGILSRDLVQHGKPDPELYLKAAQYLKRAPHQCLVLEDSYPGVLAASRAGAKVIYIPSAAAMPEASALADGQLNDLQQLAEIIQTKFSSSI